MEQDFLHCLELDTFFSAEMFSVIVSTALQFHLKSQYTVLTATSVKNF